MYRALFDQRIGTCINFGIMVVNNLAKKLVENLEYRLGICLNSHG